MTFLCAVLTAYFLFPAVDVFGQTPQNTDAAIPAEERSSDVLLREAGSAAAALAAILEERAATLESAFSLKEELDQLAAARQATSLSETPDMSTAPAELAEAEAVAETWRQRKTARDTIKTTQSQRVEKLAAYRNLTLRLAHDADAATAAFEQLAPLAAELDRRIAAGLVDADVADALLSSRPDGLSSETLATDGARWRGQAARADLEIGQAEDDVAELDAATSGDPLQLAKAERWLQEEKTRADLLTNFSDLAIGEVIADFQSRVADFDAPYDELTQRLATIEDNQRVVEAAIRAFEAAAPPDPPSQTGNETISSSLAGLRRAERAVALTESVLTYRRDRLALFNAYRSALTDAFAELEIGLGSIAPAIEHAIELDVLAESLRARAAAAGTTPPSDAVDGRYRERLERLRDAGGVLGDLEATYDARIAALDDDRAALSAELIEARTALSTHQKTLQRERAWSRYVEELEALDDATLIESFTTEDRRFGELRVDLARIETDITETMRRVEASRATLDEKLDPAIAAASESSGLFEEWLAAQRLEIEPDPEAANELANGGGESSEPAPTEAPAAETATGEPPSEIDLLLDSRRELRDAVVGRRIAYYEQHQALAETHRGVLGEAADALASKRETVEEILATARRSWGAAAILTNRTAADRIDAAVLPEGVASWIARTDFESVSRVAALVEDASRLVEQGVAEVDQLSLVGALSNPLAEWKDALDAEVERLQVYRGLTGQFDAIADLASLDPIVLRQLEAEIADRIRSDLGVYEYLNEFFASSETETIDELLLRYYERLVVNERQILNLDQRADVIDELVESLTATRPVLESMVAAIEEVRALTAQELEIRKELVHAALTPAGANDRLASLNEQYALELTVNDLPTLPVNVDDETLRNARNALIDSLRAVWLRDLAYQNWRGEVGARVEPLGEIDAVIENYEGLKARLFAAKDEISRRVERLVGFAPSALDQLPFNGAAGADQATASFGEIGALRQQREDVLRSNAMTSIAALIVIPLIALLLVLFARFLGRRAIGRVEVKRADRAGARERAETLNGIFQAIVTVVAVALAAIYMLEALNVDVGPLLASLGIFGLAVAFGAQSTMKDVFAGFFILAENKLNVGDFVTINGHTGTIESLGMRTTTLRDTADGSLIYFGNGEITNISNYSRYLQSSQLGAHTLVQFFTHMDVDTDRVIAIMSDVLSEMLEQPGNGVSSTKVFPGICAIDPQTRTFEFRVKLQGDGNVWNFSSEYRSAVVRALIADGINMPEARLSVNAAPAQLEPAQENELSDIRADINGGVISKSASAEPTPQGALNAIDRRAAIVDAFQHAFTTETRDVVRERLTDKKNRFAAADLIDIAQSVLGRRFRSGKAALSALQRKLDAPVDGQSQHARHDDVVDDEKTEKPS